VLTCSACGVVLALCKSGTVYIYLYFLTTYNITINYQLSTVTRLDSANSTLVPSSILVRTIIVLYSRTVVQYLVLYVTIHCNSIVQ
jgi:hypothetical protein